MQDIWEEQFSILIAKAQLQQNRLRAKDGRKPTSNNSSETVSVYLIPKHLPVKDYAAKGHSHWSRSQEPNSVSTPLTHPFPGASHSPRFLPLPPPLCPQQVVPVSPAPSQAGGSLRLELQGRPEICFTCSYTGHGEQGGQKAPQDAIK